MNCLQKILFVFAAACVLVSCSEKESLERIPEFHVTTSSALHCNPGIASNEPVVALALCVEEEDAEYLHRPYVLTIETLYGNKLHLYRNKEDRCCEDLYSYDGWSAVNTFKKGMLDIDCAKYVVYGVTCDGAGTFSFRLKLTFEDTADIYYTKAYTLVLWPRRDEGYYDYWLYPGEKTADIE